KSSTTRRASRFSSPWRGHDNGSASTPRRARFWEAGARMRCGTGDRWRAAEDAARRGDRLALADIEHRMGLGCYWMGRFADALSHYAAGLEHAGSADPTIAVR